MNKLVVGCLLACLSPMAQAAEPLVLPNNTTQKRFFSLDSARKDSVKSSHGVLVRNGEKKPLPLRSDRQHMDQGFMRIDRARAVPIPRVATTTVAAVAQNPKIPESSLEPESDEIEGLQEGYNPVLALFDDESGAELLSFRDAMKRGGELSGKRHLVWPIPTAAEQYLSSGYGIRKDPFHGRPAFHGGIDIAAAEGTPVMATADGQVFEVKTDARYGKYVGIRHKDGTVSRYGHLSAQRVREGQQVRAGEIIGAVGSTGRSTGAHLDYRVSRDGMKFDPLAVLTVPYEVRNKAQKNSISGIPASTRFMTGRVATNALPKQPMVIKVQ